MQAGEEDFFFFPLPFFTLFPSSPKTLETLVSIWNPWSKRLPQPRRNGHKKIFLRWRHWRMTLCPHALSFPFLSFPFRRLGCRGWMGSGFQVSMRCETVNRIRSGGEPIGSLCFRNPSLIFFPVPEAPRRPPPKNSINLESSSTTAVAVKNRPNLLKAEQWEWCTLGTTYST